MNHRAKSQDTLKWLLGIFVFIAVSPVFGAQSEPASADAPKIRYRKSKEINFEKLLIEGELKRKQISVVTGNAPDGTDGLLRLRENFLDRVAIDSGEEIP